MLETDYEPITKSLIYDLDFIELSDRLKSWDEPAYRITQLWDGLYRKYWHSMDNFSSMPKALRSRLENHYSFGNLTEIQRIESKDGDTIKTLFHLQDRKSVEAVLMRYSDRRTLCISTQAGCAMGCVFCATGQMGFQRNLTSGEIVEQIIYYARQLAARGENVTNIVMMGMGEPFHNYAACMQAIDRLSHPEGFNFGARRFTISTVGLIPGIRQFTSEKRQINLAISLHAADDELRNTLLPINRRYPINELIGACLDYVNTTHRRITFEWALIAGVNDTINQADKLARLLQVFRVRGHSLAHVNLIPLNPTRDYPGNPTTRNQVQAFKAALELKGIPCTIRIRRGIEIQAGCGQLAARMQE